LLTFVAAGGGFAGVETVTGINDFVRGALGSHPHLTEEMLRVVLVHSGNVILPELKERLGTYSERKLTQRSGTDALPEATGERPEQIWLNFTKKGEEAYLEK
jgi:NADH dehydrogenase FAD-containing subunit